MDRQEAQLLGLDLISTSEVAFVTTIDQEGFPQSRAMFNLRNHRLFPALSDYFKVDYQLYFTTNTSSGKVAHIRGNDKASVYFCTPGDWRGLNLSGNMIIIDDPQLKKDLWQEAWTMYYPGGYTDPDYAVLSFSPQQACYYHQLNYIKWSMEVQK